MRRYVFGDAIAARDGSVYRDQVGDDGRDARAVRTGKGSWLGGFSVEVTHAVHFACSLDGPRTKACWNPESVTRCPLECGWVLCYARTGTNGQWPRFDREGIRYRGLELDVSVARDGPTVRPGRNRGLAAVLPYCCMLLAGQESVLTFVI